MIQDASLCGSYSKILNCVRLLTTVNLDTDLKTRMMFVREGLGSIRGYFGLNMFGKLNTFV